MSSPELNPYPYIARVADGTQELIAEGLKWGIIDPSRIYEGQAVFPLCYRKSLQTHEQAATYAETILEEARAESSSIKWDIEHNAIVGLAIEASRRRREPVHYLRLTFAPNTATHHLLREEMNVVNGRLQVHNVPAQLRHEQPLGYIKLAQLDTPKEARAAQALLRDFTPETITLSEAVVIPAGE